jgi:hypothetical protein
LTVIEEKDLSAKVTEVMSSLDEVKKYKALAKSVGDFALVLISSVVAALFVYIGFGLFQASGGQIPQGVVLSGVESLISLFIVGGAFIFGILWVERITRRVKVGEWKKEIEQNSTLGALKILAGLDWPGVFQDIRYSKIGFVFYSLLEVVGYWILTFIVLFLISVFGLSALHLVPNGVYLAILSLIIAVAVSRKDLQRRYNQSWALDTLLWELRWFDSEFRGKAEFGAASSGTAAKA